MSDIFKIASTMQQKAWEIIEETQVMDIWKSMGATINLVGSLKTGLLIHNRDIDFHIYTNPFLLTDSFAAMARLAENSRIKKITYTNLLDAEDRCVEWHAFYEEQAGLSWQIDLIHILPDSTYAGYFEKVADRISTVLTDETREAILRIKHDLPEREKVMSILIYKAVIEDGIRDLEGFWAWKEQNREEGIIHWAP